MTLRYLAFFDVIVRLTMLTSVTKEFQVDSPYISHSRTKLVFSLCREFTHDKFVKLTIEDFLFCSFAISIIWNITATNW